MFHAVIQGTGSYVPEQRLSNYDLEQMVETNDEWIMTRTGISERRIAAEEQATSDLAYEAAVRAMDAAQLSAQELDLILVATETPDHIFPPVACQLQERLGCRHIAAFDVHLVCTGFVAALHTADAFIKAGAYRHILVVGADTLSRFTDYTDRSTCILFADGAGAVIVSRGEAGAPARGLMHSALHADGKHFEAAIIPAGGSRYPQPNEQIKAKITQEGSKVFKLAVPAFIQTITDTINACGLELSDIDWIIPHQANQRIMDAVARGLQLSDDRMISNIQYCGNNSAATIPIAMDSAIKDGRIKRGNTIVLAAFGGGVAWGSILLKY